MLGGGVIGSPYIGGMEFPIDGVRVMVGGHDRSPDYAPGSLRVSDDLEARASASFTLRDYSNNYLFVTGELIDIFLEGVHVFGGSIEESDDNWPAMDEVTTFHEARVLCVGHEARADDIRVAASYAAGQTAGAIVRDLLTNYLAAEGITTGVIEDGSFDLGAVNFPYETVATALGELAELVGFVWYIDDEKKLFFHERSTRSVPFGYGAGNLPVRHLSSKTSRAKYRNRMYIRAGFDVAESNITKTLTGDGERTDFTWALPFGSAPTVRVDRGGGFASESVGINGLDSTSKWLYQKGEKDLEQLDTETVLTSTDVIEVTYKPLLPIVVQADDDDEIADRAAIEGNTGLYEGLETDERIEDEELALQRANGLLARVGRISRRLTIEVDKTGIAVGRIQAISTTREGLSGDYLVSSSSISDRGDGTFRISYECLSGENVGGWPEFFRKLALAGVSFSIRENEILIVIREKKETITIADVATAASGDSITGWASDPYSVGLVGTSKVGGRWTHPDGTSNAYGPRVGQVIDP